MSQPAMSQTVEQFESQSREAETNEFHFRPVPVTAPVTLLLGVASLVVFVSMLGIGICIAGCVVGGVCLLKIYRSNGEFGGKFLAWSGWSLSLVCLVLGSGLHSYLLATEVPDDFRRINFHHDISKHGFVTQHGQKQFHPQVKPLEGKKIFLKGFMYPTRQTEGIEQFVLVKDSKTCCFGGQPDLADMILIQMDEGLSVKLLQGRVAVAGVFRFIENPGSGDLDAAYRIEASYFSRSKTPF